ncbi:anti-sigma factor family protein [Actinomadura opuntiae]|uniref:anti-sigma factor family protein n=1 Tax=Actinomadura sp. OS1-43 TaxID=604315 RepID=UPI00255AA896|nr:zf-HC2 domain-containing protein [Actinomadura sp. OS1-43]MDL4819125.1 zf-HC2 domain-containing protein [Actinomadura sp. OS1-43]
MSSQVEHTDVGAYALGLLEADDRRAFEAHLAGCGACLAELREMGAMAEALSGIDPAAAEPPGEPARPPAPVIDLVRRKQARDRRTRRLAYAAGAAAAAALVAVGVGVGTTLGGDEEKPPPQPQAIVGERHQATDARTGASGTVGLVNKKWGTQISFELTKVKGPLRCHLEAVSASGARTVVGGWRVPAPGYGVPGSPKPLTMQGATALSRTEISRFQVVVDGGGTLLTIPL